MTRKTLMRGLLLVFGLYLACAAIARLLAARALYYPEMGSRRAPEGMQTIRDSNGSDIAILHLRNPAARFTIWFFHGNAEDLGDGEAWLHALRDAGYSVLGFDYPGYGLSSGKPSESALNSSARAVRDHLRKTLKVTPAQTLIFGRSLGGGPAVQMVLEEPVGGLILQSSFTSVYRVVTKSRVLPFDFFENERKLPGVACPISIMHGERDEVIPFTHGEALFAVAREPKRFFPVPGARHNDFLLVAGRSFWDELRAFSDLCARRIDAAP
jgi:abhydrolase domain-containing protein 17